jgi:hypothetical protein
VLNCEQIKSSTQRRKNRILPKNPFNQIKTHPIMLKSNVTLFLLAIIFSVVLSTGCGSSKTASKSTPTKSDTSKVATVASPADTGKMAFIPPPQPKSVLEIDAVKNTTDERINPVSAIRNNQLKTGGYEMASISEAKFGSRYSIPKSWAPTRLEFGRLVSYLGEGKIKVLINLGRPVMDSLNFWGQIQEALSYGKNQLPSYDWYLPKRDTAGATQTYVGRYELDRRRSPADTTIERVQINTVYLVRGDFQHNLIIEHPIGTLSQNEAEAINSIMASFAVYGDPTVDVPRSLIVFNSPPEEKKEDPKAKKGKGKKGTATDKKAGKATTGKAAASKSKSAKAKSTDASKKTGGQ